MRGIKGNSIKHLSGSEEAHPLHGEGVYRSGGALAVERGERMGTGRTPGTLQCSTDVAFLTLPTDHARMLVCVTDPFTIPSICPSIHIYIHLYIHTYTHLSIRPSTHPHIHTYIHLSIRPSIHPSIHPHIHTYIHTYIHTFICKHLSTSHHMPGTVLSTGDAEVTFWAFIAMNRMESQLHSPGLSFVLTRAVV